MFTVAQLEDILKSEDHTLVIASGNELITSRERGVRPLVELIRSGGEFRGGIAADKVVGKAAALLYSFMGISELFACVASQAAADVCKTRGINLRCDTIAPYIVNRRGDDMCPMEKLTLSIEDPRTAFDAVSAELDRMGK